MTIFFEKDRKSTTWMKKSLLLILVCTAILITPSVAVAQTTSPQIAENQEGEVLGIFEFIWGLFFGDTTAISGPVECENAIQTESETPENLYRDTYSTDCEIQKLNFVSFKGTLRKTVTCGFWSNIPIISDICDAVASLGLAVATSTRALTMSEPGLGGIQDVTALKQKIGNTAQANYARPFAQDIDLIRQKQLTPRQVLDNASARWKLNPVKCKSLFSDDWVPCSYRDTEKTMQDVFVGYACPVLNKLCGQKYKEIWQPDYTVGYAMENRHEVLGSEPGGGEYRGLKVSDFVCARPTGMDDLSGSDVRAICAYLYGPGYAQGNTSSASFLGQKFGSSASVARPTDTVLFPQSGYAWKMIPAASYRDEPFGFEETVIAGGRDDPQPNVFTYDGSQPSIAFSSDVGEQLQSFFTPYKMKKVDKEIPAPRCNDCIVSALETDPGGSDDSEYSYTVKEEISNPFVAGAMDVAGVTDDKDLAQAQLPPEDLVPADPNASPPIQRKLASEVAVRETNIVFEFSKKFKDLLNNTIAHQGWVRAFMPVNVVDALEQMVDGTPLYALPGAMGFSNEQDRSISRTINFPFIGGVTKALHRCGYLNAAIAFPVGYREKWCGGAQADNFDRWFAQNIVKVQTARKIDELFAGLASFNQVVSPLDDLSQTNKNL